MRRLVSAVLLAVSWSAAAPAQELRIGIGTEPTTMDPHFYNLTPNTEATAEVFDTLVWSDLTGRLIPSLAQSWTRQDDRTWTFNLRPGVVFSDGTPLTVEDVLFTFKRAPTVPNSPSSYAKYLSHIVVAEAVDEHTLRVRTDAAYPALLSDLTQIAIVSRKHGEGASTTDYNSGAATIGTGPYKLVEWVQGDRLVYVRNELYWGPKPFWVRVIKKPIPNQAARTAALASGTVDLINQVSPDDLDYLGQRPELVVRSVPEDRLMYLSVDLTREVSPFVTDKDGRALDRNPLRDVRVRQAMSKAIDRAALASRVMSGQAIPAGDLLPAGEVGTDPTRKPDAYDPAGARKLLAEAGYPDGFGLTVHGPNDRYVNDAKLIQTVAQFLTRVGIVCKVETIPKAVYFGRLAKREFTVSLVGTSPEAGAGTYSLLSYMLATRNAVTLRGNGNWNYYSSPEVDALIDRASLAFDEDARQEALVKAAALVLDRDRPVIPLVFNVNSWAMRKEFDLHVRSDSYTLASDVTRR